LSKYLSEKRKEVIPLRQTDASEIEVSMSGIPEEDCLNMSAGNCVKGCTSFLYK